MILETIHSPADVKALEKDRLPILCQEVREFLIENVSKTGGHLASNLGAVELTVAIHRVFDTEKDRLVFDVGHQCYVHKILTGRSGDFPRCGSWTAFPAFPSPMRASTTPLWQATPPTPCPWRWAWPGQGHFRKKITVCWPSLATAPLPAALPTRD